MHPMGEGTEAQAAPSEPVASEPATDRAGAEEVRGWNGHRLDEVGGAAVGKIEGAFVDEESGQPEWLLARIGRFGHHTERELLANYGIAGDAGRYAELSEREPQAITARPLST
jgi:hypothetical protein